MTYKAGDVYACGPFTTTAHPTFDWETYSEAGYVWHPELNKWGSLPGMSAQNRGLKAVGARNYVQHPSFRVLSLSFDLLIGLGNEHWVPPENLKPLPVPFDRMLAFHPDYASHPWPLILHVVDGGILEAWNVGFEWTVWNFYCVPVWGWPELTQDQVRCCMAKSRASAYPGALDEAGHVLRLTQKKDKRGGDLIRKLTVPRNPTKGNPDLRLTPITEPELFREFYDYNRQDVRSEIEASVKIPDLSPRELAIWRTDLRVNMRGMGVAVDDVENCIAVMEEAFAKFNGELRAITNGAVEGSTEVAAILTWMSRVHSVHMRNLDEDTVEDALGRQYPPAVLRVLRIRQVLAYGSVKKLYAFRAQTTAQGRLHDQYVYYGAHTGMWNGRGVQPANLYKGIFSKPEQVEYALSIIACRNLDLLAITYGKGGGWCTPGHPARGGAPGAGEPADELEVIASCLRSMIVAKPGHRLISADFTAIQAVATSALAGEEWRLEVFRTHGKIYEAMASRLTDTPLQFYLDYKKQHGKHHEHRQNPGKLAVLSGDFGAWINGWKQFGADKLLGSDANIKAAILKTRDAQPAITELWGGQTRNKFGKGGVEHAQLYGLEGAAISAVLSPGECFGYRGIKYQQFGDTLYCIAPSGGFIRYHAPRLEKARPRGNYTPAPWELSLSYEGNNSNATKGPIGWIRMDAYGGVLTQNIVSHMCREIQADALMALEANGYPVVMHTHDEQVAEVPNGHGSVDGYMQVVRGSLPTWARTPDGKPWPVKVPDAWEAQRYGKWGD